MSKQPNAAQSTKTNGERLDGKNGEPGVGSANREMWECAFCTKSATGTCYMVQIVALQSPLVFSFPYLIPVHCRSLVTK